MSHIDLELHAASISIMVDNSGEYADLTVKQLDGRIVCLLSYEHHDSSLARTLLKGIEQAGYTITRQSNSPDKRTYFVLPAGSLGEGIEIAKTLFLSLFPNAYMQLWYYSPVRDPRLNTEIVVRIEIGVDPKAAAIEVNHSDLHSREELMPKYVERLRRSGLCRPRVTDVGMAVIETELTDEAAKNYLVTCRALVNLDPHLDV